MNSRAGDADDGDADVGDWGTRELFSDCDARAAESSARDCAARTRSFDRLCLSERDFERVDESSFRRWGEGVEVGGGRRRVGVVGALVRGGELGCGTDGFILCIACGDGVATGALRLGDGVAAFLDTGLRRGVDFGGFFSDIVGGNFQDVSRVLRL